MARLITALALLLASVSAWAMPQAIPAVLYIAGATATQVAIATIVVTLYTAYSARRQQKKLERQQRDAYNAGLQDRTVTIISANPPRVYIYGRATVGPIVSDTLTSGDRDEFKHVVMCWAAHECDGIEDFLINGESVGALDADGYATASKWVRKEWIEQAPESRPFDATGRATITRTGAKLVEVYVDGTDGERTYYPAAQLSGTTITGGPISKSATVVVKTQKVTPYLRVRHHLGGRDQVVDPVLNALFPGVWTTAFRGRGICYSVATFELNEPDFQGGLVNCTARVRGMKVLDPRTGLVAWSDNPALCTRDYLCAEYGKASMPEAVLGTEEAANDCDELVSFGDVTGKRYTCNGTFDSDADTDSTLEQLVKSMAGFAAPGGVWRLGAGVYKPPTFSLGEADLIGAAELMAAPGYRDSTNGMRGSFYDPLQFNQAVDYQPYSNAAYVAADGGENWGNLNLHFTDSQRRARSIAAVEVEQSRAPQLVFRGRMRCLALRVGDRCTVTLPFLGIEGEVFRVAKRELDLTLAHVRLTLIGDSPQHYAVLPATDATREPIGDAEAVGYVYDLAGIADGSRVGISVQPSADPLVIAGGALLIQARGEDADAWADKPAYPGNTSTAVVEGVRGPTLIRCAWQRLGGVRGEWCEPITVEV